MKTYRLITLAVLPAMALAVSCNKVNTEEPSPSPSDKVSITFSAVGEPADKATLDFNQAQNVRWADDDLIAVFDAHGDARDEESA